MPILRPTAIDSVIMAVMKPNPPICISASRTSCDGTPKPVDMSTVPSPVTHTPDVAIKSASSGERGILQIKLFDTHNRRAPAAITSRKPVRIIFSTLYAV